MLTATAPDGTQIRAHDTGAGPAVLILGPGLDDGSRTKPLADRLAARHRVLRLQRRRYRLDLPPCALADEVTDVLTLARAIGSPVLLYGHSSGGVLALECLAAAEAFTGAVIFEAPVVTGPPLGGAALTLAREALAHGRPGRAMAIFLRDVVGLPALKARLAGLVITLIPKYRRLVPAQLDDLAAIDALGDRLGAYRAIGVPVTLLSGEKSPAHLIERLTAVRAAVPGATWVSLPGRDHGADLRAPGEVAAVIEALADRVSPSAN
ncbi:hypothetical protein Afil01_13650 [Actinorhabdospora filicis]|uniref:AB hydrolase-1 domain-containing protein n=1 Tax=Actinorhabdospora filicis TaxID=1785913 RepID=A0A9W6SID4_9ACTN|nr:alpha/beta hydrolase [Actinorhabdospora filicis]GLZ76558.1 hypothetical protein Afil01_13650 [Actinorhabdospora filicis]